MKGPDGKEIYLYYYSDIYNLLYFINNYKEYNDIKSCLYNSGKEGEYAPENLKNCYEAYFFPDNDTYVCHYCIYNYILDENTHKKKKKII